jgi:chorismate dehydratase
LAQKIRVGAVSYLNTKPLVYGFEQGLMADRIELVNDHPANIAAKLLSNEIDIGLVPVAIIPTLKQHFIVSGFGIGTEDEVASVCLFSDVPINEIESILLDYQSRTSVALLKILLKEHWNISPELIAGSENYEQNILGKTAGLVIGDRAFRQRLKSKYIYDLGHAWREMTGLPFLFAAWISNIKMDEKFKEDFDKANEFGLDHLEEVIANNPYEFYDLKTYYTKNISYVVDEEKEKGLLRFLEYINKLEFIGIQNFSWCAIGFGGIKLNASFKTCYLFYQCCQFFYRKITAGANIHMTAFIKVLH